VKKTPLTYWLIAVIFIFPLFFFPWVRNFVAWGKNFFLYAAVLVGLIVWAGSVLAEKKKSVWFSSLDGWLAILLAVGYISLVFLPMGSRVRIFLEDSSLGTLTGLFILSLLISQTDLREKKRTLITALTISTIISVLISIVLFLLPDKAYPLNFPANNPIFIILNPRWSTFGSVLELGLFIIPLLAYWLPKVVSSFDKSAGIMKDRDSIKASVFTVFLLVGLGLSAYPFFRAKASFLGYRTSWVIAAEAFKRNPLFGAGLGSFPNIYTLYRPVELNQTASWSLQFDRSASYLMQIWTETGTVGLVLWLLVLLALWRKQMIRQEGKTSEMKFLFAALIVLQLLAPINIALLFLYFIVLGLTKPVSEVSLPEKEWFSRVVVGVTVLATLGLGYFVGKVFVGEFVFIGALRAVAQNRAGDAYRLQSQAIRTDQYVADYRISQSQTDLALANAIASNQNLTDDQKNQVTLLIQEAIAGGKAAASLEPGSARAWENLAQIYRQIINLAQGADQWTVAAYQQAIALDPFNPLLRIDLGGVYYGLKGYEQASRSFEQAVQLKADYANAWYNLAWSLKQQGKLVDAIQQMQQSLALVEPSSADFQKANQELEAWKKELGSAQQQAPTEGQPQVLKQPEPLPSPQLQEQIKLPKEAAPEISVSPSPAVEPTGTPTVTMSP